MKNEKRMTNEEAIDVLKNDIEICTIQQEQACDMAIKALKIVQGIEDAYMRELLKTPLERGVLISDVCDGCRYELNSTNGILAIVVANTKKGSDKK